MINFNDNKNAKKLFTVLFIGIFSLISCNKPNSSSTSDNSSSSSEVNASSLTSELSSSEDYEKALGFFNSLEIAFDNGYLINEYLLTIANYLNNEIRPTIHMPMDAEIAELIKETHAANLRARRDMYGNAVIPYATANDVEIVGYYGNYNESYAVMITDNYTEYTEALWSETINGVTFNYNNGNSIVIWRESAESHPPLKITDFPGLGDLPINPTAITFGTNLGTLDEETGLYGEPIEYNVPNEKKSEVVTLLFALIYEALPPNIAIDPSPIIEYLRIKDETNRTWHVDLGLRIYNDRFYEPINIHPFINMLYEISVD